jgi:hypothetical protein
MSAGSESGADGLGDLMDWHPEGLDAWLAQAALPKRVRAVRDVLLQAPTTVTAETVARNFVRARVSEVRAILETLTALGQARSERGGYWA